MKQWEYCTENRIMGADYRDQESEFLSKKGREGWELAGVCQDTSGRYPITRYFFKREIKVREDNF